MKPGGFLIFVTKWFLNSIYMKTRRDVYQGISDPTRREIIQLLANQSLNLNAVAKNFKVSRPAISKHIRILTECGLITISKQGRERYCQAHYQSLNRVSEWVNQYRAFWTSKLDSLEIFLDKQSAHIEQQKTKK
jgi:DNA-binding transcriptional ArsR family regulator